MSRWVCPFCEREFARTNQGHVCVPGGTVDETFAEHPDRWREVFDAILAHLQTLGPVHVDAVAVGVFLKSDRKLAEVRPRVRAVDLMLAMPRPLDHPRIARRLPGSGDQTWVLVKLTDPSEVDGDVQGWLTEAYAAATG